MTIGCAIKGIKFLDVVISDYQLLLTSITINLVKVYSVSAYTYEEVVLWRNAGVLFFIKILLPQI